MKISDLSPRALFGKERRGLQGGYCDSSSKDPASKLDSFSGNTARLNAKNQTSPSLLAPANVSVCLRAYPSASQRALEVEVTNESILAQIKLDISQRSNGLCLRYDMESEKWYIYFEGDFKAALDLAQILIEEDKEVARLEALACLNHAKHLKPSSGAACSLRGLLALELGYGDSMTRTELFSLSDCI